jgi:hypothetical protein
VARRLIPGKFGTIEQDDIGRAFAAEFTIPAPERIVYLEKRSDETEVTWVCLAVLLFRTKIPRGLS